MPHSQPNWSELAPILVLMVAMVAMFWFIVVRPTKKRQQDHVRLIESVSVGDDIVTVGGIYGKIVKVREDSLDVEVAPKTVLTFDRRAIRRRREDKE